jgi:mRNA interferase RelE/StbE
MIVKYRKSFFNDVGRIKNLKLIEEIEFITETANRCSAPVEIPGFKPLRQYPGKARIEISPYRIGIEVVGDTIIFKRVIPRSYFYLQFP